MSSKTLIIKDPVCGMIIDVEEALKIVYKGKMIYFCSEKCKNVFLKNPDRYAGKIHLHGVYPLM